MSGSAGPGEARQGFLEDDMVDKSKWEWFGFAGHFICGRWCRFHLTTKVGDYLVSTIGQFVHPVRSGGRENTEAEWLSKNPNGEQIGHGRTYETMVFRIGGKCQQEGCDCGLPTPSDWTDLDMDGYNDPGAATRGHMAMCEKWAAKDVPVTT